MKMMTTTLRVGAERPFSMLHMSDTHIALADERDSERKRILARNRASYFTHAEEMLQAGAKLAHEKQMPIVHTGDLTDFVSYANLDRVKRFMGETDCFMAAGNHEFSQYVGEVLEDAPYRNQSLALVQSTFPNNIRFCSRKINGVNLIAMDNGYYLFEEEQMEMLREEVKLGLPIILLMHTPLYTPKLSDYMFHVRKSEMTFLINTPEEEMLGYLPKRYRQQKADATTVRAYHYIMNEPLIRGLVTGHLHFDYEEQISPTLTQIVTGCTTLRTICVE